jgi:hypothetical protein
MMRTAILALCGLAVLQASFDAAQDRQPTFKSTTELVEVDAVILDKDGNFVPGLKAEDVTIYENGKPQKIQQFFMVTHDLGLQPGSVASEYAEQAQYGAHRVFVMLFDEAHMATDSLMRVKTGAEQFVREMFTEGDAGGVFVNGGMTRAGSPSTRGSCSPASARCSRRSTPGRRSWVRSASGRESRARSRRRESPTARARSPTRSA